MDTGKCIYLPDGTCRALDSTKEEVLQAMGNPDESSSIRFYYGNSDVKFSSNKVNGWDNHNGNLAVPGSETPTPTPTPTPTSIPNVFSVCPG
jgi:hypothetical protein